LFVLGNLLAGVATILDLAISLYTWIIIINVILSWIRLDPFHPLVRGLARVSDLICDPIRRIVPMGGTGFDFSPLIAILLLMFTRIFLVGTLRDLAVRM
jgi:YggT family protein